ncbi:tetratricopeptide repeat protein [Lysobacter tyrosinilyticus]
MNRSATSRRTVLVSAVAAVLALGAIAQANAQNAAGHAAERRAERDAKSQQKTQKVEEKYPQATRKVEAKASAKGAVKLQKLQKAYNDDNAAEARALADEIIANTAFNDYDRSFAAQVGGFVANDSGDAAAALDYWNKALQFNGLDNNSHYQLMLNVAQLQIQDEKYAEALATLDRLTKETNSQAPAVLVQRGNVLYRLERYPEAIAALKQVLASNPEGATLTNAQQLLMASYSDSNQPAEAAKLAEEIAARTPNDRTAQLNLANTFYNIEQYAKAAAVMEKLRAAGQLTGERDYKLLYNSYNQLDGKEKQVIEVINDGLQKGILKPDYNSYISLAQAYYYSEQINPAIETYKKAAPLDDDGETYLNLARLFWQENRIPEAKEAAKQALAKGIKKPEDAKKILALPAK